MRSETPQDLASARIPRHIAIIMDGNGRWARSRGLSRIQGHRRGMDAVRNVVTECRRLGVSQLTLYAFSEENWRRPASEVRFLMRLLRRFMVSERPLLAENEVSLHAIGDMARLPDDVLATLKETMALTAGNKGMALILALSYGGRDEIVRAVRSLAGDVRDGALRIEDIDAPSISERLDTCDFPDPDLLIRTSGEMRLSNFMPWQTIYTEIHITPKLWPDFVLEDLHRAILDFSSRERRFGLISEQVNRREEGSWERA